MPLWKQALLRRYMHPEPGAPGSGNPPAPAPAPAPGAPPPIQITPEIQAVLDARVAAEVAGLKSKNTELLGQVTQFKTKLQEFDGIEPEAFRKMTEHFDTQEEQGLLKKGDLDGAFSKRTERLRKDYDKKLEVANQEAQKHNTRANKLAARAIRAEIVTNASKTGALQEALEDVVLRGQALWHVDDEGNVVAKDSDGHPAMSRDGKTPLTMQEWLDSLRESAPHLWPRAQGSNAPGSGPAAKGGVDYSHLPPAERITRFREAQGGR